MGKLGHDTGGACTVKGRGSHGEQAEVSDLMMRTLKLG